MSHEALKKVWDMARCRASNRFAVYVWVKVQERTTHQVWDGVVAFDQIEGVL